MADDYDLSGYSDEELQNMLAHHQAQGTPAADYSQSYKRGIADSLRDFAYGALKGNAAPVTTFAKQLHMGVNMHPTGNLMQDLQAGYREPMDFANVKSSYPSAGGDLLQTAGEFLAPEYLGAKFAGKGIKTGINKIKELPLTESMAAKGYPLLEKEWANTTGQYTSKKMADQVSKFLEQEGLKASKGEGMEVVQNALKPGYQNAFELQKYLNKLKYTLAKEGKHQESVAAENLRSKSLKELTKALEQEKGPEAVEKFMKQQGKYKTYKNIDKNLYAPIRKKGAGLGAIAAALEAWHLLR